ncbi:MAG: aminodeoxychorismate synthase component I [bacterium]
MDPTFVLIDFPGHPRLSFTNPVEVIVADDVKNVRPALARVEARAAAGYFAVGFVSYDAAPAFDSALRVNASLHMPLLWFAVFTAPTERAQLITGDNARATWRPHVTESQYERAIADIQRGIRDGTFYQVNHTLRLRAEWSGDPRAAYEALRAAQPAAYGMYVDTGRFHVLSVSPELFFSRTGRDIQARPMKGTARRGRWPSEDASAAAGLKASPKERAENVMIVDLVRNDLGRIADVGSVTVSRLFEVEQHPTVWQMTSTISARLPAQTGLPDIFGALFPCGSVVGAPKIAAASWIADHEDAPRGVYCGSMGIVRPGGDCTFNVAIRTLVIDGESGIAEYGAGGGITIDSTPAGEYDELMAKAAVLQGPSPDFQLLETMRLTNGAFVRRERHLSRLVTSAEYFAFPDVRHAATIALDERARTSAVGDHRVRLLAAHDGTVRTEATPFTANSSPQRCAVAQAAVNSSDPFLFHKTTHRVVYNERRAAHADVDEVILVNERGELTECSVGNLVLEIDGVRFTPPLDCGLLPGVFREELLARGAIHERVLHPADLQRATRIWRINSLREWTALVM